MTGEKDKSLGEYTLLGRGKSKNFGEYTHYWGEVKLKSLGEYTLLERVESLSEFI